MGGGGGGVGGGLSKTKRCRVPKCDVVENEICEIMGFVKIF